MKVQFFDSITIAVPKAKVYSRLGYAEGKTQVTKEQQDMVEKYIEEAVALLDLKGAALRMPITSVDEFRIKLLNNIVFESKSLVKFFLDCQEVLFMAATGGSKIMKAIKEGSAGADVTKAVIFDAVASEMVDSALGWVMDYFSYELRRENKTLTSNRFSAGYGDFSLDNQEIIYNALELKELGVTLTQSYMLVPEKSVTALAGIKTI
jgi:hypothetical protein